VHHYEPPLQGLTPRRDFALHRELVGWWPILERGGRTFHDYSGFGGDITLPVSEGDEFTAVGGRLGHTFNGSDEYGVIPNHDRYRFGAGPFTLSLWFKSASAGSDVLLGQDNSTTRNWNLWISGFSAGKLSWDDFASTTVTHPTSFSTTHWNHVVVTRGGTVHSIYLNGAFGASVTAAVQTFAGASSIYVASREFVGFREYFPGTLSDIRIWRRALSQSEVKELYSDPWAPFQRPTIVRIDSAVTYSGSGAATAGAATASGSGTFGPDTSTASGSATAGSATAAGTGTFLPLRTGTGAATIGAATASGSGTFNVFFTGSAALDTPAATAIGIGFYSAASLGFGSAALVTPPFEITGTGTFERYTPHPFKRRPIDGVAYTRRRTIGISGTEVHRRKPDEHAEEKESPR